MASWATENNKRHFKAKNQSFEDDINYSMDPDCTYSVATFEHIVQLVFLSSKAQNSDARSENDSVDRPRKNFIKDLEF